MQASPLLNKEKDQSTAHSKPEAINDRSIENLISLLSTSPVDMNDLLREAGEPPANIHQMILELELAGRITRHAGGQVSLNYPDYEKRASF